MNFFDVSNYKYIYEKFSYVNKRTKVHKFNFFTCLLCSFLMSFVGFTIKRQRFVDDLYNINSQIGIKFLIHIKYIYELQKIRIKPKKFIILFT